MEAVPPYKRTYKAGAHAHNLHPDHIPISHNNSPDYKTMSGPDTGEYLIQLVADPRPPIGVDDGSAPLVPVVTDGNNNIVSPLVFVQCQLRSLHPSNYRSSLCLPCLYILCSLTVDRQEVRGRKVYFGLGRTPSSLVHPGR